MSDSLQVSCVFKKTQTPYKPAEFNKVDSYERAAKLATDRIDDGLFNKAMKSAKLAIELAKTGSDKNKVFEAFKEALITAEAINDRHIYLKNGTKRQISFCMNEAGLNALEITALYHAANVNLPD